VISIISIKQRNHMNINSDINGKSITLSFFLTETGTLIIYDYYL